MAMSSLPPPEKPEGGEESSPQTACEPQGGAARLFSRTKKTGPRQYGTSTGER